MTDLTNLPTAADSATFVEAYREWRDGPVGNCSDAKLATAMFACFPGESPDDDERCVTIDGLAFVAKRDRYADDSVEYEFEHYLLDCNVVVTKPT